MKPLMNPSHQTCLIKTVGIIAKTHLQEVAKVVVDIRNWLKQKDIKTVLETETARLVNYEGEATYSREELPNIVDLVLMLGGDGTLLSVASRVTRINADIPILAVNFGSLGFLTEITLPELYDSLESVIEGTAEINDRDMLRSTILRNDEIVSDHLVLNDVVIGKTALSSIIEFSISIGKQFVMSCRADGLIIASPTGSTAYNLAVGGPIVHPNVDALLLTPIAPHMLTNRPIVIPTTTAVRITPTLSNAHQEAVASFDGQDSFELTHGDIVMVERAPHPLKLVRAQTRSYFAVLRQKLKWGER